MRKQRKLRETGQASMSPTLKVAEDSEETEEVGEASVDLEIGKVKTETKAKVEVNQEEEADLLQQDLESTRSTSRIADSVAKTTTRETAQPTEKLATSASSCTTSQPNAGSHQADQMEINRIEDVASPLTEEQTQARKQKSEHQCCLQLQET